MYMTSNCPLCGGKRYANDYGIHCLTNHCPYNSSCPQEEDIRFGWKTNPDYMKKHQKYWIKVWDKMGKNYLKWLAKFNGEILLSTEDCIKQLKMYAESCKDLDNPERGKGLELAANFLELFHEDCWEK